MTWTDWIGSAGVAMLLVAFFLNLFNMIPKSGLVYLLLNTAGAVLACVASIMLDYLPFVILEGCWALVSLVGLIGFLRRQAGGAELPDANR
jgi:hypothetical protein